MRKQKYEGIDINVYEETLDNGFKIYICKMPFKKIYARISVSVGNAVNEFIFEGKKYKVSPHSAHFLEHILFDKKEGDIAQIFRKNAAYSNASTGINTTNYYFLGSNNFYENLNVLLRIVNEPYFTDELVSREKGVIEQELKNKTEKPSSIVYQNLTRNLFYKSYYKDFKNYNKNMVEDLYNLTKEEIELYYNAFYKPNNMSLVIVGDIDLEKTVDFVRQYYQNNNIVKGVIAKTKHEIEPETVFKEKDYVKTEISNELIQIAYKIKKIDDDLPLHYTMLDFYFDYKLGNLSNLNDLTEKDDNYITPYTYYDLNVMEDYFIAHSYVIVKQENKSIEILDNEIKDIAISKSELELEKKSFMSSLIKKLDNPQKLGNFIAYQLDLYKKPIYNIYMIYKNMEYDDFIKYISNLDFNNKAVIVYKKEI